MWDKIKKFAVDSKAKATELVDKGLKATPDLAKKATVGLKSSEEFEEMKKAHKRFVVVFGRRSDLAFQKIILKMPYYLTLAFITSTKVKTMELDDFTDFSKSQTVTESPTVLYFKQQELLEKHEGVENVEKFLGTLGNL